MLFRSNGALDGMENPKSVGLPEPIKDLNRGVPTSAYNDYRGPMVDLFDPKYLQAQQISSRWEFDRQPTGLYNVSVSWMAPGSSQVPVYAFEVNLQAQSIRGLNTAATQLLAEGFPPPAPQPRAAAEAPKKSPGDYFPGAINDRRQAYEQGEFDAVWQMFSRRRKNEMEQGGIGRSGFVRMQKLTYRMSPGLQQTILKTKPETDTARLVLLRQSQPKHPDIFIKQSWVWEDNAWRLDEEEKKIAAAPSASNGDIPQAGGGATAPAAANPTPAPASSPAVPPNLPGLSDSPSAPR